MSWNFCPSDTCKRSAVTERRTFDTRYAVGYDYACKRSTFFKRVVSNTCNANRYRYAYKYSAIFKRPTFNFRYGFAFVFRRNYQIGIF